MYPNNNSKTYSLIKNIFIFYSVTYDCLDISANDRIHYLLPPPFKKKKPSPLLVFTMPLSYEIFFKVYILNNDFKISI